MIAFRRRRPRLAGAGTVFPALLLLGCSNGYVLRHTASDLSEAYASSVDQQLLLNLARLANDQSAHFMQLGQITAQYNFTSSAGLTPSHVGTSHPNGVVPDIVQNSLTLGGSLSAGAGETPTFSFVPLSGTAFADVINTPIKNSVFNRFLDQGFHADLLVRVMAESVTVDDRTLVNNPRSTTYGDFLLFCAKLRRAQLEGILEQKTAAKPSPLFHLQDVKLPEAVAAMQAGYRISDPSARGDSGYAVAKEANPGDAGEYVVGHPASPPVALDKASGDLPGFGGDEGASIKFKLRTFEAVMYSVAKEERYFNYRWEDSRDYEPSPRPISFGRDGDGVIASVRSDNASIRFRPVLTLTGFSDKRRAQLIKSAELRFDGDGKTYTIGDVEPDDPNQAKADAKKPEGHRVDVLATPTSNQAVFTLIGYLFAQVSIDPQKLPVQQLIQVP